MNQQALQQWRATQAEFGELVGISQPAVSAMTTRGILLADDSVAAWLLAYCGHLREVAAGRDADSPLATERARLASAQAERVEMANLVSRKQLAPVSLLEAVLANICRQVANQLDAILPQIRLRCPDLPGDAMRVIEDAIVSARQLAAESSLSDSDAQVDLGDDELSDGRSEEVLGASLGASSKHEVA